MDPKPTLDPDLHDDEALPASDAADQRGFLPVLRNGQFLLLWSGQVFSQIADKVFLILVIALIASRFQQSGQTISGWVSAVTIVFTIPAILFGSIAGVYVDRWSKKAILASTNLLRGLLVAALPLLLTLVSDFSPWFQLPVGFWVVLAVTFAVSTLTQFFSPAEQTAIPLLVQRRNLLSANSLYTTTMIAALIVGFAVGEPLLELTDAIARLLGLSNEWGQELLVGGSYALAGVLLLFLNLREPPQRERATVENHVWQDIWDGIQYLRRDRVVRNALIQLTILFCVFAALTVLTVRLAEVIPGLKSSQFGFLLACGGVGLGLGAGVLGRWGDRVSPAVLGIWGSLGMAASLVGLSLATQRLWLALALTATLGLSAAAIAIPMQTTVQAETPEAMRGKVFGLQNNAVNIALSLPLALASVAEAAVGLPAVFLGLAAVCLAGGGLNWYISRTGLDISTQN